MLIVNFRMLLLADRKNWSTRCTFDIRVKRDREPEDSEMDAIRGFA